MENITETASFSSSGNISAFNDPRTLTQILTHFVLLRVAAVVALISLNDARHVSKKARVHSMMLMFFLPTFQVASMICRTAFCIHIACTKPWPYDRWGYIVYLACAALGIKTSETESGEKLSQTEQFGVYLLSGESEDFQRVQCLCMNKICRRWTRRMVASLLVLLLAFYYCAASLFLNLLRRSYSWQHMGHELLTGTPPGQHDGEVPARGLNAITGLDELNGPFALCGLVVSGSAIILKVSGWTWKHKTLGVRKERNDSLHLRSIPNSSMDARFELPLAMILYVALAHQYWVQLFNNWNDMPLGVKAFFTVIMLWWGCSFVINYVLWSTNRNIKERTVKLSNAFGIGIVIATEWVLVQAIQDPFDIASCLWGKECLHPLYLWKTPWSDTLWVY